ncbi:MAG: septum formation initiator family protein [Proteobacteria bacterium]|nr:septum formation initiator family protein [Pseudomonadota bacterium]
MGYAATHSTASDVRPPRRERVLEGLRTVGINLLFVVGVLVVGYSLLVTYDLKQQETALKRQEVEAARAQLDRDVEVNDRLKSQIRFLRTDAGVEKVARDALGLVRPNEQTYVVVNAPSSKAARLSPPAPVAEAPAAGPGLLTRLWSSVVEVWNGGD